VRVLYVIEFENMGGGIQRCVELLIRHITALDISVAVLLPCRGETSEAYANAGAQVFTFGLGGHRWAFSSREPLAAAPTLLRFARDLTRAVRLFRPHVIHTQHTTGEVLTAMACHLNRIHTPRVFSVHGNVYRGTMKYALRRSLRSARRVVIVTRQQRPVACQLLGVDEQKVVEIPNATDLHLRARTQQDLRRQWGVPSGFLVVSTLGFPSPLKCQETFIEAAAKTRRAMPNAKFVVVGGGGTETDKPYLSKLRRMTSELDLTDRVVFAGYCPDGGAVMEATDVVVSTSLSESFGRTIIEAWARRKPVIATRAGGPQCIIDHGVNGYLFEPRDTNALCEHLEKLASSEQLRQKFGAAGLAKDDARVVARQHFLLYRDVIREGDAGPKIEGHMA